MRNKEAKLTFIILTFNVTFMNKSYGIPKEDALNLVNLEILTV